MITKEERNKYAEAAANQRCRCWKCDGIRNDTKEKCGPKPCNTCNEWRDGYWTARLALEMYGNDNNVGNKGVLKEIESKTIVNALKKFDGNKTKVCEFLGISRATLYRKIKEGK